MQQKDIPIDFVLAKLNISFDNTKSNITMECPCCGAKKLNINFEKNFFRCAKCDLSGNSVHLFAALTGRPILDKSSALEDGTYRTIRNELMGGGSFTANYTPMKIEKKDVATADKVKRGEVYQKLFGMLSLSDFHYNNLVDRGLREKDIVENGYRSSPLNGILPAKELRGEGVTLKGIPGFFYENEAWRLKKTKGMYIPVRDVMTPGNSRLGAIKGVQIRSDKKDSANKYIWLSSIDLELGAPAVADSHFVGYPENTIRITEGPLKGDVIYRFLQAPVLAVPGVNSQEEMKKLFPILWKYGVRRIKTCFDMDYLTNQYVEKAYFNLVNTCMEYGFQVERETWDANFKGLDDFLLNVYLQRGGKLDTKK